MPMPPGALDLMRSAPQRSDTYLIIQQPVYRESAETAYVGYEWSCRVNGAPAGDPIAALVVDGGAAGPVSLLAGMTVAVSGVEYGAWDKALVRLRGDQTVSGATTLLNIATSSDLVGIVDDDDYVTVWDEFRLWQRYGRIIVDSGDVTWYKDYNILWDDIAPDDARRRLAMMPPTPIMGPHAVKFIEVGESATVDFDWSDSYANAVGESIISWSSTGETDHVGGSWTDTAENPSPKTYSNISGLAGFRVSLNVQDGNGLVSLAPYRRGIRYVFTMRRPGQTQPGDPTNAEPITSFELGDVSSSYSQGYSRTRITVYEDEAYDYMIIPGALVIVFTEDWYAGEVTYLSEHGANVEVGPIHDRENVLMVGRIADGSITVDSETQAVSFDVISVGEEASKYDNYPMPIEHDDAADDWIKTPSLTVHRALWYYITWHTTLSVVTDVYLIGDDRPIKAMDFMAGSIYSSIDSFLQSRMFARMLFDRYSRAICEIDVQMEAPGTVPTLWVLDNDDWLESISVAEASLAKTNYVELGGVSFVVGKITPYMSGAPGQFDKYRGNPTSSMALAIDDQDDLNVLSGRLLAYRNNLHPNVRLSLAGNWRICDIVPQEAIYFDNVQTVRGVLDGLFIIRDWSRSYDAQAGAWFTSIMCEQETDGPPGNTIVIPDSFPPIPAIPHPRLPVPPGKPPGEGGSGATDTGRRMITTNVGVFVTDGITASSPYWYAINDGLDSDDDKNAWSIRRDPHHWWTTKGEERKLWVGTETGIYYMDDFPAGTWVQQISLADLTAAGAPIINILYMRMNYSIEEDGIYAFCYYSDGGGGGAHKYIYGVVESGVISNIWCPFPCGGNYYQQFGWPDIKFAPHSNSNIIYGSRPSWDLFTPARLHRTLDRGGSWTETVDAVTRGLTTSISIPYVDPDNEDLYVLWGSSQQVLTQGQYRISEDGGATFDNIDDTSTAAGGYYKIGTGGSPDYIFLLGNTPKWSNDRGVTWTELPATGYVYAGPTPYSASYVTWNAGVLQDALIGGSDGTVLYWSQGYDAWVDKTGNLASYGVSDVRDIDRDSMGVA